ncbi:hypothetical protein [Flavobacterium flavigenum]|uniref:hypothetical protein n=1 Tax=Flavobacterium flavigenum TaxID=3003258 RepID=UPI0024822674|nr:hypothetical protein [Flavobacterium flavigenum]
MDDFKENLKALIREKKEQIYKRTGDDFSENDNFKKLLVVLHSYRNNNIFQKEYKTILIKKIEIENLSTDIAVKVDLCLKGIDAVASNHLVIDRNAYLISSENSTYSNGTEARKTYLELSKDYCVFFINPSGIHYFIDGIDVGDTIFFTPQDYDRFSELKDVNKIIEVLDEYRKNLELRDVYRKFFVLNTGKRALHQHLAKGSATEKSYEDFLLKNQQLLNNVPEDIFREDLRLFLKTKLNAKVLGKELVLENFKRLDIFIYDEYGDLYFLEVKWVGISIHRTGQKITTEYTASDINPNAVIQTLGYLKELNEKKERIKMGYLAVFDARKNNVTATDTVAHFDDSVLAVDLQPYYRRFFKIPDFKVINKHPY